MRFSRRLAVVAVLTLYACSALADKRYDYPAWGFSVVFPVPPSVEETQAGAEYVHSFEAKVDKGDGEIRSVQVFETAPGETLDSVGRELSTRIATGIQGDAGPSTQVRTPEGVVGREIRFSYIGRPIYVTRYFLVGRMRYEVSAGATDGFEDPFVTGFLNSFRLTGKADGPSVS